MMVWIMESKCKCGHGMFNIATNGRFARCVKCGTIYDCNDGEEVEIHSPYVFGDKIFVKKGEIQAPRILEYKGNLLDDGIDNF